MFTSPSKALENAAEYQVLLQLENQKREHQQLLL